MSQQEQQETLADANRRKLQYLEEQVEAQEKTINRLQSVVRMLSSEMDEDDIVDNLGEKQ